MAILSGTEIKKLQKKYDEGVPSSALVTIFGRKGERFSEATLRKYVQLGLLPKSTRVGTRGRHRGSSGRYPVSVLRLINSIKSELDAGKTLEEIRLGPVGLSGVVDTLERAVNDAHARFVEAIKTAAPQKRVAMRKKLDAQKKTLAKASQAMGKIASGMA